MVRLVLFFVTLLLVSCSSNKIKDSENPELVYNEAVKEIADEDYLDAKDYLDTVKKKFPQSRFAVLSDLRLADIEFAEENFTEAAAIYGVFVDLHPNHADAPYALHRKALAYLNDSPGRIARDQGPAGEAVSTARKFLSRYPNSQFTKEVEEILTKARVRLAEKEAYIAKFYTRKSKLDAANARWIGILSDYADLETKGGEKGRQVIELAKARVASYATKKAAE
jgi:outer membrane protein assembly factor BamD